MKKQFMKPGIRIVRIDSKDIIVTSPGYDPRSEFSEEESVCAPARIFNFD